MEERIIGYDVREMWYKEPCDFRMGSKLVKMLSVDHTLWSSIFHHGGYGDLVEKDREEKGYGMIELPPILFGTRLAVTRSGYKADLQYR
jgi:hypothetical protein